MVFFVAPSIWAAFLHWICRWGVHVRYLSSVTPRYLTWFTSSIVVSPILMGLKWNFLFFAENIIACVFSMLSLSPLFAHHVFTLFISCIAWVLIVGMSMPLMWIAMSSAKALMLFFGMFGLLSNMFRVMFHRKGESTPPWGHPLVSFLVILDPLFSSVMVRLLIMWCIHSIIVDGMLCFVRAILMLL